MKKFLKNILFLIVIFLILSAIFSLTTTPSLSTQKTKKINFTTLIQQIDNEQVKSIQIVEDKLIIKLKDGTEEISYKEPNTSLISLLKDYSLDKEKIKKIDINIKNREATTLWLGVILPFLIPFLIISLFIYLMSRQVQKGQMKAMLFGQTKTKIADIKKQKVTFKDVAGVKEAKEELQEVVEFLKNPKKFISLGARIPKGILLLGPPGCGKTLLARAVAGEANVPFFHISGSEFVEMFVGVGAARVRDLFQKAKRHAPSIVFIDELDAVGRQRGTGLGGSHDEREQTLNQILVELDGFEPETNVIVLAATNRPDVLDPALLRPGRFDRRVVLDLPDLKDREKILEIHARNKPLRKSVSLKKIAKRTPGFSGADLANLLNEAAILAARRGKKKIGMSEILESIEKTLLGPERKSHILTKKEKKITAYHEAGHALVSHFLPHCDPVRKVSIIARGRAAGYTLKTPSEDKHLKSKSEFEDELAALLGGYAAEKEIFGEVTTGATNDLRQATELAKKMVTEYGMSDRLGPRTFGKKEELIFLGKEIAHQKDYSDKIAQLIDEEVSKFVQQAYQRARELLRNKRKELEKIVHFLLEKETLEQKEFENILKNN